MVVPVEGGFVKRGAVALPALFAGLLVVLVCTACAATGPEWVDEGQEYTLDGAKALLNSTEAGDLETTAVEGADELRADALAELRSEGDRAAAAADLLTATFPAQTKAVPFYVERATVDGAPTVIVVEAWGPREGVLELRRVWVIDEDSGNVLDSSSVE
jgi:hypothetical protein